MASLIRLDVPPSNVAPPRRQDGGEIPQVTWNPPTGLVGLSFANMFLGIITLGIYHFWGRTEVRKRIWSAIRVDGEPLEYTGTGKEMLIGFLLVFVVVLVPLLVVPSLIAAALGPHWAVLIQMPVTFLYVYLFGVGMYRALRYRLSRTRWRGIRGALVGNSWRFGWTSLWTGLLVPVTLGWIYPWRATRMQKLIVEDMRFGDRPFSFVENPGPLYGRFIALWVSGLVVFFGAMGCIGWIASTHMVKVGPKHQPQVSPEGGALIVGVMLVLYLFIFIAGSWYRAGQFNHFASSTSFEGAPLRGTMTGLGLIGLSLSNIMIILLSLGILYPIAQVRSAKYFMKNLKFTGPIVFDTIAQGAEAVDTKGEGLAQAFDFDAF